MPPTAWARGFRTPGVLLQPPSGPDPPPPERMARHRGLLTLSLPALARRWGLRLNQTHCGGDRSLSHLCSVQVPGCEKAKSGLLGGTRSSCQQRPSLSTPRSRTVPPPKIPNLLRRDVVQEIRILELAVADQVHDALSFLLSFVLEDVEGASYPDWAPPLVGYCRKAGTCRACTSAPSGGGVRSLRLLFHSC